MRSLLSMVAVVTLLVPSAAAPAEAAIVTYPDRAAWEAAVSGFAEVDFDGFPGQPVSYDGATVDVGPFSLTGDDGLGYMSIEGDRAWGYVCGMCPTPFGYSIDFDAPILAFGADYGAVDIYGLSFDVEGEEVQGPLPGENGFFGFVSTTPFTSIRVFGRNEVHEFDNVVFASAPTAIPTPAALSSLGISLVALAATRRRRR
jgi:hypothetical protein